MFNETFKTAVLSAAHLTSETLNMLDVLEQNNDLPYWVHPTDYGYIVRFAVIQSSIAEDSEINRTERRLIDCADFMAIGKALQDAGIAAAYFDSDGPIIDGLPDYSQGQR
ncbi:hypothetical protein H0963_004328 [Salmonella enterica]|nr:hypothetical protein [Salmonella enterica]